MEENVNFDNEVLAYLSTRKDQLIFSHSEYQQQHPEIREVLNDFISSVLLHKPVSTLISSVGRRLCLRQGILPPLQPNTSPVQAIDPCWTFRSREVYSCARSH